MSASIERDGSITLSWSEEDAAWQVGDVLYTYGKKHNDQGFIEDGRALMDAADEVVRRKAERAELR